MNLNFRPLTPAEYEYSYSQTSQMASITGCVGKYIEEMETDGMCELTSTNLTAEDFQPDFNATLNALRHDSTCGGILAGSDEAHAYCRAHPENAMNRLHTEYGFRIDTEKYAYILRLLRFQAEKRFTYVAVIFCYLRERLDGCLNGQITP